MNLLRGFSKMAHFSFPSLLHSSTYPSPSFLSFPVSCPLWSAPTTWSLHMSSCIVFLCHLRDRTLKQTTVSTWRPLILAVPWIRQSWGTEGVRLGLCPPVTPI